jgi:hypothetical protein
VNTPSSSSTKFNPFTASRRSAPPASRRACEASHGRDVPGVRGGDRAAAVGDDRPPQRRPGRSQPCDHGRHRSALPRERAQLRLPVEVVEPAHRDGNGVREVRVEPRHDPGHLVRRESERGVRAGLREPGHRRHPCAQCGELGRLRTAGTQLRDRRPVGARSQSPRRRDRAHAVVRERDVHQVLGVRLERRQARRHRRARARARQHAGASCSDDAARGNDAHEHGGAEAERPRQPEDSSSRAGRRRPRVRRGHAATLATCDRAAVSARDGAGARRARWRGSCATSPR